MSNCVSYYSGTGNNRVTIEIQDMIYFCFALSLLQAFKNSIYHICLDSHRPVPSFRPLASLPYLLKPPLDKISIIN